MKRLHPTRSRFLLACGILLFSLGSLQALPVFPGAVGFGTDTPAGRGGQIVRVTNLLDDYQNPPEGSFRWAVERMSGPRVIIFEVGGVIELRRNVIIRADDHAAMHGSLTIAGQTAPWPGITLKNAGVIVHARDVLIQHIAVRPGTLTRDEPGWDLPPLDNRDCIGIGASPGTIGGGVVIDHVSATWATDEMVSVWSDNGAVENATFLNSIFAEPILNGGHSKGAHGFGPLSGRNASNITIARNLMAFNWGRNPLVRDLTNGAQVVNNFVYRPGVWPNSAMYFAGPTPLEGSSFAHSVVGNVIVRHPVPFSVYFGQADGTVPLETYTTYYNTSLYFHNDLPVGSSAYLHDNRVYNPQDDTWYPTDGNPYSSSIFRDASNPIIRLPADPYAGSGGTAWIPWPASEVEERLLAGAGKFPARPDPIDAQVLNKVRTRTGAFVAFESDLGPEPWEPANIVSHRPLTTPENPNGDDDGDGYTNLEEWLHAMAAEVETVTNRAPYAKAGPDQSITVDGVQTYDVTLDGSDSFDLDGDSITHTWTWAGGSTSGETVVVTLPVGETEITLTVEDDQGGVSTDTVRVDILDPPPVIALSHLTFTYNGEPKPATVTTHPEQLAYEVLYDGSETVPTLPGSYEVVATVTDPDYNASASGVLVIKPTALVRHGPTLDGNVNGSVQVLTAENVTLNGNAAVLGDLLLPGTPALTLNGSPSFDDTIDGPGEAAPSHHRLTLNGSAALRHLVQRVDPIAMPAVAAPAAPTGTRDVTLNNGSQSAGDFATLRNLTLNSGAGSIDVPPGTYGAFAANSGAVIRIGIAGATEPATYELQGLTLNVGAQLQVIGPVVLTLAQGAALNGAAGSAQHPEWLDLRVATGGITLNGSVAFHGSITAPAGQVALNGSSLLAGSAAADRLVINGASVLQSMADRTAPVVLITAPDEQELVRDVVEISATATDNTGVAAVQFFVNDIALGYEDTVAPYSISWDTATAGLIGPHVVSAVARDFEGNLGSAVPVIADVADQVPPSVVVTAPAEGATVNDTITLSAAASDNVELAAVTFQIDGVAVGGAVTAAPYQVEWDTTAASNGGHLLTAVARDEAGNTTTSEAVNLIVWNGPGTFVGYEENFDDGLAQNWNEISGSWELINGYYRQLAANYPDLSIYDGQTWETDFIYSASLRASWSAVNNRLGMIYNYVDADNYYYVIFNLAGLAEINRVINGSPPEVVASVQANELVSGGVGIGQNVWFEVDVVRSGVLTSVLVNGETIFSDIEQLELGVGKIGFITRSNGSARFDSVSISAYGPTAVFDTFEDGDVSPWFSDGAGTWGLSFDGDNQVLRQSDPNVFANRAVRVGTNRRDQLVEADVKLRAVSGNNRFFGVVARYRDPGNYYYFILRTGNTIELKELVSGRSAHIVPPQPFIVQPGEWYRLRLEVVGNTLKAYINGELQMQGTSSSFPAGSGGLLTFWSDVVFDDIHIDPDPDRPLLAADDFEDGDAADWSADTGSWSVETDGSQVYRQADTAGAGRTVIGDSEWSDQIVELDLKPLSLGGPGASVGFAARSTDIDNHYSVALLGSGIIELRRTLDGVTTVLAGAATSVIADAWHALRLTAVGASLKVYLDGQHILEAVDATHSSGGVALLTEDASADFDDIIIVAP